MSTAQITPLETLPRPGPSNPLPAHFKAIEDSCPKSKDLPRDYRVNHKLLAKKSKSYRPPGKLVYGFGIDYQDLIDYADKRQVIPPDLTNVIQRYTIAFTVGLNDLRKLCNFYDLRLDLPVSAQYQLVLTMYDNYTIDDRELDPEEEADVIRILQEQLPICSTQNPRWFFDRMDERNGV